MLILLTARRLRDYLWLASDQRKAVRVLFVRIFEMEELADLFWLYSRDFGEFSSKLSQCPGIHRLEIKMRGFNAFRFNYMYHFAINRIVFIVLFYESIRKRLADILGHSSVDTTRIYLISTGEEHQRMLERMRLVS